MRSLILTIFTFFILGCAASGPIYSLNAPEGSKAVIYLYVPERNPKIHGRIPPTIRLNDNKVGALKYNGHFRLLVEAGKHELSAQVPGGGNLAELKIKMNSGEIKYVFYTTTIAGGVQINHQNLAMPSHYLLSNLKVKQLRLLAEPSC